MIYTLSCLLSLLFHGSDSCYKKLVRSSEKETVFFKLHINGFFFQQLIGIKDTKQTKIQLMCFEQLQSERIFCNEYIKYINLYASKWSVQWKLPQHKNWHQAQKEDHLGTLKQVSRSYLQETMSCVPVYVCGRVCVCLSNSWLNISSIL